MALLHTPPNGCSTLVLTEKHSSLLKRLPLSLFFRPRTPSFFLTTQPRFSKAEELVLGRARGDEESDSDDDDSGKVLPPETMTEAERAELRREIYKVLDENPTVEEETDPRRREEITRNLAENYPLVVDDEDPNWPEDAEGRGFKLDQFFDKIRIKNVKKEENDDGYDSEKEVVWQDDDHIKAVKDITEAEWEDTVFKDFNPLVVLVHHRYRRHRENEKARVELEKAVKMFWDTGLPSPRCVAVDGVVEEELVNALKVSRFPEIIFTKAGKILHRDKAVRDADQWAKIMAFFYYKAVRPPFLDREAGEYQEKIPSLS